MSPVRIGGEFETIPNAVEAHVRSITEIVKHFKQNWTEELNSVNIAKACRDSGMTWIESMLNPVVTIQIFFLQILIGNTACTEMPHLARMAVTAAGYCNARMRIKLSVFQILLDRCVSSIQQQSPMRTGDMSNVVELHPELSSGDVLVADRGFCSFAHLCLLIEQGVEAVFRIHQLAIVDFTPGRAHAVPNRGKSSKRKGLPRSRWLRSLGVTDQVVAWLKSPWS